MSDLRIADLHMVGGTKRRVEPVLGLLVSVPRHSLLKSRIDVRRLQEGANERNCVSSDCVAGSVFALSTVESFESQNTDSLLFLKK